MASLDAGSPEPTCLAVAASRRRGARKSKVIAHASDFAIRAVGTLEDSALTACRGEEIVGGLAYPSAQKEARVGAAAMIERRARRVEIQIDRNAHLRLERGQVPPRL
jgi:hypothetical protein